MKKLLFILLAALTLCACTVDTECRQNLSVEMGITFTGDSLKLRDDGLGYETVQFNQVKGLKVWGVGRDSLLADGSEAVKMLPVPLRKDTGYCAFALEYRGVADTLYCRYDNQLTYVSLACGCAVFATIDAVSSGQHLVDSLAIQNYEVGISSESHLYVRLRTPQDID